MSTAIYTRISLDHHDGAGVARQEQDCRDHATTLGLTITSVYSDNNVSAYDSNVRRPDFERLLDDIQRGHITSVVVWATDRLYRRLSDLERIVATLGDVPVHAVKSGDINLATADGRLHARMMGSVAQHSSEKLGERVSARARQRALSEGRSTSSVRPFGWERCAEGLRPHPTEGPAVAAAYQKFLAGESLSAIARWLTSEGFTGTRGGTRFTQARVSAMLRLPRHGGLVQYKGQLTDTESSEGRIVDAATWREANRVLAQPGRKRKGPPAASPLTGLLTCYKCGGVVRPSSNQSRAGVRYKTYACVKNHVSWRREELDDAVTSDLLAYLTAHRDTLLAAIHDQQRADAASSSHTDTHQALEVAEADLAELGELVAARTLTPTAYVAAAAPLERRISELRDQITATSSHTDTALLPALTTSDLAAHWEAATLTEKRDALRAVYATIAVHPKRSGRVVFNYR